MNHSPLQLSRHFFTKVVVEANPNGKPEISNQLNCHLEVGQSAEDAKQWQVTVRLKLESPSEGEACYTGEIHAVGLFRVVDGWPDEKIPLLVEANGAALLYGAIREMLLNLTARGPWAPVLLNSMTFIKPKPNPQMLDSATPSDEAKG